MRHSHEVHEVETGLEGQVRRTESSHNNKITEDAEEEHPNLVVGPRPLIIGIKIPVETSRRTISISNLTHHPM